MAKVLDQDRKTTKDRFHNIPELMALYSDRLLNSDLPAAPTEATTMLRNPSQVPALIPAQDLGQMVKVTEKLLGGGLKKLGVPEATIKKLRDLSGLRIDAGAMLAVSLQDTHQLYYLQLLTLQARADEIKKRYLSEEDPDCVQDLPPMERMFWQRAHTEIVEQLGKGYDRMMAGTQAMVAMMKGGKDKNAPASEQSEAGWTAQVPKSVSRAAKSISV